MLPLIPVNGYTFEALADSQCFTVLTHDYKRLVIAAKNLTKARLYLSQNNIAFRTCICIHTSGKGYRAEWLEHQIRKNGANYDSETLESFKKELCKLKYEVYTGNYK